MTKLLVSVRSLAEAKTALNGGADVIDIKEPQNGALGAATFETIKAIADELSLNVPVSAALGELRDIESATLPLLPASVSFAKIGLAGCQHTPGWQSLLESVWSSTPQNLERVAVAYADWKTTDSPDPKTVAQVGNALNCNYFLLDTQSKSRPLLDVVTSDELEQWFTAARDVRMQIVVAGSLQIGDVEHVIRRWSPDILAVRGAACEGGRTDAVSQQKVSRLKYMIAVCDTV